MMMGVFIGAAAAAAAAAAVSLCLWALCGIFIL
jgi:hypothetical protein